MSASSAGNEDRTRAWFERLCDLAPAERERALATLAHEEPTRAGRVRRWLAADARANSPLDRAPRVEPDALPGAPATLAHYTLGPELGRGGMGVVFRACQRTTGEPVALKLLHPGLASEQELRRFLQEAEALRRLEHPGIARFLDAGVATTERGPQPYLAIELVEGRPLAEHAAAQALDRAQRLALVAELCDALEHAHRRGIVHRDLKPANVLVDRAGRVKVLDFGIARIVEAAGESRSTLTEPGQMLGTLAYMSPEQLDPERGPTDARSDVWALGVIAYELLCGAKPFELEGASLARAARIVSERAPVPLARRDRRCAGALATLVHTALAREPGERYASAAALADDLRRFMAGTPIRARRPTPLRQLARFARQNRAFSAALAVAVLAILAGLASSLRSAARERRERGRSEQRARALELELYRRDVGELQRALADGAQAHARTLLGALPAGPAGFEARHFAALLMRAERPLSGARETIYRLASDAAGKALLAAAADGSLRVHALESGAVLHELDPGGQPRRAVLSPDGRHVLALGWNPGERRLHVSLWNDGRLVRRSEHPSAEMGWGDAAFAPSGERVYWGWNDGRLRALALPGGEALFDVALHTSDLRCLALEPGGKWLVTSGHDGDPALALVEAETGAVLRRIERDEVAAELCFLGPGPAFAVRGVAGGLELWSGPRTERALTLDAGEPVLSIASSRDGLVLHACTESGRLFAFETSSGRTLSVHSTGAPLYELERLEEEGALAGSTREGRVVLLDLASGEVRAVLAASAAGAGRVTQLLAVPGGRELAAGYTGGTLCLWPADARRHATLRAHESYVYDVAFVAGGRLLVSSGWDRSVRTFEADGLAPRASFALPSAALALEPLDDRRVLVALKDGPLAAFALDDGRELWRAPSGAWLQAGAALSVAPGGAQAVVFDPGRRFLRLHAGDDGSLLAEQPAPGETRALAHDAQGHTLAVGGRATLALHDPLTLAPQRTLALEGQALDLAFAPDGSVLAVATEEGRVEVFELASGTRTAVLPASGTPLHTLCFDPTGTRLATGSDGGEVTLWDTRSWARLLELDPHRPSAPEPTYHYVHDLAFRPDGTQLASASGDHTVRVWHARAP